MEGIGAQKMMMSLMVLMMIVLAQGQAEAGFHEPSANTGHCAKRCTLKCAFGIIPARIALCFGICMLACKIKPSQVVYQCTSNCANSMVNRFNPTDTERVESFVDSCYETCKQNNNN